MRKRETNSNVLADGEWRALLDCVLAISGSANKDDVRYQALAYLAQAVPFQCAAFFLASNGANRSDGCLVAQPAGRDVAAEEFERRFSIAWNSIDANGSDCWNAGFTYDYPESDGPAERSLHIEVGRHLAACALGCDGLRMGALLLCRTDDQGIFSERDLMVLSMLAPHLTARLTALENSGPNANRTRRMTADFGLTKREAEIMSCVGFGMTSPEIAQRLSISNATVKKHLERIYRKAGVNNRMSLMRLSLQYQQAE